MKNIISRDEARQMRNFINATDGLVAMAGDASDVYARTLEIVRQELHDAIHATLITLAAKIDDPQMWRTFIDLLRDEEV